MANKLTDARIGPLLLSLAIPTTLAQFITLAYSLIDRIYIGRMDDGVAAMTAVGLCMPITIVILAITNLFGRGGAPLSGIHLGAGEQQNADKIMTNSLVLLACTSFIITMGVQLFCDPLLILFGASEDTLPYARDYLRIYSLGTFFFQSSLGMTHFINTQGFTKTGMLIPLIGGVVNIILDPIFIFLLDMGIRGAAIATVLSQIVSFLWALRFQLSSRSLLHVRRTFLFPHGRTVLRILGLGAAPAFMVSTEGILLLCFNTQLARFGGDISIGAMAILSSVFQLLFLPMIGMCQGAQPILSFNYGAGRYDRVRKTILLAGKATLFYSLAGTTFIVCFPQLFVRMFTTDSLLLEQGTFMLRIYMAGGFLLGLSAISQDTYTALGDGKLSFIFAFIRKGILLIPLIFILPFFLENKVIAVVMAEPVSDLAAAIISGVYFFFYVRRKLSASAS